LGAPVAMSPNARGSLGDAHPLAFEMLGGQELWDQADVALIVGTRYTTTALAWGREAEVETIRIDVDPTQIVKPRRSDVEIVAAAGPALEALARALAKRGPARQAPADEHAAVHGEIAAKMADLEPLSGYGRAFREALPDDAMVFADVTRFSVFTRFGVPFYCPRSFFMPGFQATLGWAYPAALGGKVAAPERKTVAIMGDGGFMFTVQELATAMHHDIPVTVLVFDNKAYGNVKTIQANRYGGRHIAVDLTNPDFVALAQSFGMAADRVEAPDQLAEVLGRHLAADRPSLIEVGMPDAPNVWSLVRRPPSQGQVRG
jgi:acetolactate synthase-1/2/3 large subunit